MNHRVVNRRIYVAGIICLVISLILIVKLFRLHFSDRIVLSQDKKTSVRRGTIRDAGGYILATSIELNSVFANPREIKNPGESAAALSSIIGVPAAGLEKALSRKNRQFIWLKRKLDNKKIDQIRALGIKGVYFRKEFKRVYPHDTLAANILGFVGVDNQGLEGIEYKYNDLLSGADALSGDADTALGGGTVTLTIDRYIQHIAEQAIAHAVQLHRASQGSVVIFEVKTGRILGIARYPVFNPNDHTQFAPFDWRNFAVIDAYEPGSTFKILALAALLEGVPGILNQVFQCTGSIEIFDTVIRCTGVHGRVTIRDIIRHSCNAGIIQAMHQTRRTAFYELLARFGFGERTGIELPGEAEGILRTPGHWSGLSKYSLSIGHEMSATSIQMVAAFGAIANRGVYMAPTIIQSIEGADGTVVSQFQPRSRGRVISSEIARILMDMMRAVILNGTGSQAASLFFAVVGKTGTSRKANPQGGYSDRVIASFVGIAPYEDPAVCILVVVDDPADRGSGGDIAAPVFAGIIDRVLIRLGITSRTYHGTLPVNLAKKEHHFSGTRMPDFRGMRIAEALAILSDIHRIRPVQFSLSGSGRVYSQLPLPGTKLADTAQIQLYFSEE